jgi:methionine biosynthesis protein MetW
MPTYDAEVDAAAENNSHSYMVRMVGPDRRVLDVGCATGYLGEVLMERGCRVKGVELDEAAALEAAKVLDEVVVADLEQVDLAERFGDEKFDVIVFGDVLEHLRDPGRLLRSAAQLLDEGGSFVISVPNVTHAALRLALLQGRWTYTDRGLLDSTHVTFFTRASLIGLIRDSGLVPIEVRGTTAPPFGTEVAIDPEDLPEGAVEWVEQQPDADVYQFVVRAVRPDATGVLAELRERTADLEAQVADLRAELAAARELEQQADAAQVEALERAAEAEKRASASEAELRALAATRSFRLLRAPRRAYSAVRRPFTG